MSYMRPSLLVWNLTVLHFLAGGITKSEMSQLSQDQIEVVAPATISQIPPLTFSVSLPKILTSQIHFMAASLRLLDSLV